MAVTANCSLERNSTSMIKIFSCWIGDKCWGRTGKKLARTPDEAPFWFPTARVLQAGPANATQAWSWRSKETRAGTIGWQRAVRDVSFVCIGFSLAFCSCRMQWIFIAEHHRVTAGSAAEKIDYWPARALSVNFVLFRICWIRSWKLIFFRSLQKESLSKKLMKQ